MDYPVTTAVAPAGSGKSTLLAYWLERLKATQASTSMLDLTPLHSDPRILLTDLIEACRQSHPDFGRECQQALASLADPERDWRKHFLRDCQRSHPDVIFLDNYHNLDSDSASELFFSPRSAISLLNSRDLPTCYLAGVAETQL
jgi:ATP/maltotriose-dependent transcriptional regulator MalT